MGIRTYFLLVVFISLFLLVKPSHFRGATFSWRPASDPDQIEISWRISWRTSYSSNFYCDMDTITNKILLNGEGSLSCYDGCTGSVKLYLYCTDFSVNEDWTTGVYTTTFSSGSLAFTMSFASFNWIGGLYIGSNGRWSLPMYVNLTRRDDTGMPNSSPVSSVTPIVQLQHGCNHTFVIPVTDPDGDTIRCRWASSSLECGSICNGFPNAILDEDTCTIQYNAVYNESLYGVALMIEDFDTEFSTTPLSQIPLQFIVNVSRSGMSCAASPEFVYPTPEDGSCISVPENETYRQTIVAVSGSDGVDISAIDTVSPLGLLKSPVIQDNQIFFVNLTWTPTQQQIGGNILCFTAHNTEGQSSPQMCITLVAGASAPNIIRDSVEPATGSYVPSSTQSTWRLKFDKEFQRPTTQTYVRFYEAESDTLVHSIDVSTSSSVSYMSTERSIEFTTNGLYLQENKTYYILMDSGVARGMELCGSESPEIVDPGFWWIEVRPGLECRGGCLNGGTCDTSDGGSGGCKCSRGFAGPTCKRILGFCSSCNLP